LTRFNQQDVLELFQLQNLKFEASALVTQRLDGAKLSGMRSALMVSNLIGSSSFGNCSLVVHMINILQSERRLIAPRGSHRPQPSTSGICTAVATWTVHHVAKWLDEAGIGSLKQLFLQHDIVGQVLLLYIFFFGR